MANTYNWMLPTKITLPGGANQNQQYDSFGQVIGIQSKDPAQNPLMDLSYTHDKAGNIRSKTNKEGTTHYTYDDRYRLTGVAAPNPADNESYSYDPAGNRLTAHNTTGNWQYNNNNQLLAYGERSFTYDKNGNTTTESDTSTSTPTLLNTYVYNQQDRLTEVQDGSATVIANYDYDPLGRRIKKTTGGATTYYLYSDDGLVAEFDELGNELQSYGYVPNSLWGTSPLYTKTEGAYAYYHTDHLGTPQMLTTNNGAKVWEGKMDAFGQMTTSTGSITNNLRFPGQYYDQESGQHYNYFRQYDPGIGRYTSSDPIGVYGGINSYAYGKGNPIYHFDNIGLLVWTTHPFLLIEKWDPNVHKIQSNPRSDLTLIKNSNKNVSPNDVAAATNSTWEINFECVCDGNGGWVVDEYVIDYFSVVYTRNIDNYKRNKIFFKRVINDELDHVSDFDGWAETEGRKIALKIEKYMKKNPFKTKNECKKKGFHTMENYLADSHDIANAATIDKYDGPNGAHHINPNNYTQY